MTSTTRRAAAAAAGALVALALMPAAVASAASNDVGYGVTSNANRLITFSLSSPDTGTTNQGVPITGLGAGETVVGIDVQVVGTTSTLYALTDTSGGVGRLYTVNTSTAAASPANVSGTITLGSGPSVDKFDVDVNPCSNGIRIVGSNNVNIRLAYTASNNSFVVNNDTTLAYASGDSAAGATPVVGAVGYTPAVTPSGGTCSTALYDVDFSKNTLVRQGAVAPSGGTASPNNGDLSTVGALGVDPQSLVGLDVRTNDDGTGTAYMAAQTANAKGVTSNATQLFTVDVTTGKATLVGNVGSDLLGAFAVGPAPSATNPVLPEFGSPAVAVAGAAAVAGLVLAVRRRREA